MTYERRIEISSYFRNKNFMTPTVVRYGETEHLIYELSLGKGFSQNTIYGVTVLTKKGEKTELGECLHSRHEAEEYISSLESL